MKKTIKTITTEPVKEETTAQEQKPQRVRGCFFCQNERSSSTNKQRPSYTDIVTLKRYLSDRGKILQKGYTKTCSKHQREVTKQIKYARHLALLPFTPKV